MCGTAMRGSRSWIFRKRIRIFDEVDGLVGPAPSPVSSPAGAPACRTAGVGARRTKTAEGGCPTTYKRSRLRRGRASRHDPQMQSDTNAGSAGFNINRLQFMKTTAAATALAGLPALGADALDIVHGRTR